MINDLLDKEQVDLAQIRKISVVRGLVNSEVRGRVWPLLLGVEPQLSAEAEEEYLQARCAKHADSAVVECDLQRSLWSFTEGWSDEARDAKRDELRHVLTAAVCAGGGAGEEEDGEVRYYQGMHDVAAVLLFEVGERSAYVVLRRLARCQLRDSTRPAMHAVVELLGLLLPLLRRLDAQLAAHLEGVGLGDGPPVFALAWLITWFAHGVPALPTAARLFDAFLASHPLLPLYAAAAAMKAARKALLAEEDGAELHRALTRLDVLGAVGGADELARRAARELHACPPQALLRAERMRLVCSTAAEAYLGEGGRWEVPDKPAARLRPSSAGATLAALAGLAAPLLPGRPAAGKPRGRAAAVAAVASLSSLAAAAVLLAVFARIDPGGTHWRL
ncbi:hypothetical protein WJX81_007703 [Elliptochloris bilobata]|uniref:Rab-GAP TBC domain-containing protein n=1 Tax=Elliptochloris bilobata TaxID=381761 RepID=A0AAW1SD63_9CHLO